MYGDHRNLTVLTHSVPTRRFSDLGQGGTGMTGGVPYGRPLPGWAEDRDGLKLDQLQLRLGPAYPGLPPGLVLDLHMQGDILQDVGIGDRKSTRLNSRH